MKNYNESNNNYYFIGSNVRIDTTLLGFDNMNWQRGSRSYVFKGNGMNIIFYRRRNHMIVHDMILKVDLPRVVGCT